MLQVILEEPVSGDKTSFTVNTAKEMEETIATIATRRKWGAYKVLSKSTNCEIFSLPTNEDPIHLRIELAANTQRGHYVTQDEMLAKIAELKDQFLTTNIFGRRPCGFSTERQSTVLILLASARAQLVADLVVDTGLTLELVISPHKAKQLQLTRTGAMRIVEIAGGGHLTLHMYDPIRSSVLFEGQTPRQEDMRMLEVWVPDEEQPVPDSSPSVNPGMPTLLEQDAFHSSDFMVQETATSPSGQVHSPPMTAGTAPGLVSQLRHAGVNQGLEWLSPVERGKDKFGNDLLLGKPGMGKLGVGVGPNGDLFALHAQDTLLMYKAMPVPSPERFRVEVSRSPGAARNPTTVIPTRPHTLDVEKRRWLNSSLNSPAPQQPPSAQTLEDVEELLQPYAVDKGVQESPSGLQVPSVPPSRMPSGGPGSSLNLNSALEGPSAGHGEAPRP